MSVLLELGRCSFAVGSLNNNLLSTDYVQTKTVGKTHQSVKTRWPGNPFSPFMQRNEGAALAERKLLTVLFGVDPND